MSRSFASSSSGDSKFIGSYPGSRIEGTTPHALLGFTARS
jgi:hypothetical protein